MICFSEDIRGGRRNKGARVNMEFTRPCHTSCRGNNINLKFREPRNSKFRIAGELNLKSWKSDKSHKWYGYQRTGTVVHEKYWYPRKSTTGTKFRRSVLRIVSTAGYQITLFTIQAGQPAPAVLWYGGISTKYQDTGITWYKSYDSRYKKPVPIIRIGK